MSVYYALLEHGDFEKVLICNAAHVKNVPGRKTDYATSAEPTRSRHEIRDYSVALTTGRRVTV